MTAADYKPLQSSKGWASRTDPHEEYVFFENARWHPFRPAAQKFEPVNAWWLMDLSLLSYWGDMSIDGWLKKGGLQPARLFGVQPNHAIQAMVTSAGEDVFVVFRGTTASRLADVLADIDICPDATESGYVHAGFAHSLRRQNFWTAMSSYLETIPRCYRLWFTGHSLGAAMATIAAQQFHERYPNRKLQIYTFGSPRVGGLTFKRNFEIPSFRIVNDRDAVPLLPPPPLYWHVPELVHIGPYSGPIHPNMFKGTVFHLTFGMCDFRLTKAERQDKAEQLLVVEHPRFDKRMVLPMVHHNPKAYALKVWNHYVWSEVHSDRQ